MGRQVCVRVFVCVLARAERTDHLQGGSGGQPPVVAADAFSQWVRARCSVQLSGACCMHAGPAQPLAHVHL